MCHHFLEGKECPYSLNFFKMSMKYYKLLVILSYDRIADVKSNEKLHNYAIFR